MQNNLSIIDIKNKFWIYTQGAVADDNIIKTLLYNDQFINKESELWDFKEQPSGNSKDALSKTLCQVVSFHNTYGGYLIYGVKETKEGFFPVGVSPQTINNEQVKDKIAEVTGTHIDTTYAEVSVTIKDNDYLFGILHIPKRSDRYPVFFGKNSPQKSDNSFYYKKDQQFMRMHDSCIQPNKAEHYKILYSSRIPHYIHDKSKNTICLSNTLPHRNSVCSKFFGRSTIINQLWEWLGDPLSYYKLIAGQGGLGKTSVAYEFAEQICNNNPLEFDHVIWLTGKRKQFIPSMNDFTSVPETHFSDLDSLLVEIGKELAFQDEELDGNSSRLLKAKIKKHLQTLSMFVIIDDIDSLELEEQKKVVNTIQLLANEGSRFLLTTRMNLSYPVDDCIVISGLDSLDFVELVDNLCKKFDIKMKKNEKDMLLKVTDGSPLFAESIIRLIRTGFRATLAIKEWKGQSGEVARAAALHREIKMLSPESKRILLIITLLHEASLSEIRQLVSGYSISSFEKYISELTGLFLISSPLIISTEKRFEVSSNTSRLVLEIQKELVTDYRTVIKQVKGIRNKSSKTSNNKKVGRAIFQAISLQKENRIQEAVETIENTMNEVRNNKDLLFAKGRFLLMLPKPSVTKARESLKQAHVFGQIKDDFFECWFSAEALAKDYNSQLEVTNLALDSETRNHTYWLVQRAKIAYLLSEQLQGSSNEERELHYLNIAEEDLSEAIKRPNCEDRDAIVELAQKTNDRIYYLATYSRTGQGYIDALNATLKSIKKGDCRRVLYGRAFDAIDKIISFESDKSIRAYIDNKLSYRINDLYKNLTDKKRGRRDDIELKKELMNIKDKFLKSCE